MWCDAMAARPSSHERSGDDVQECCAAIAADLLEKRDHDMMCDPRLELPRLLSGGRHRLRGSLPPRGAQGACTHAAGPHVSRVVAGMT